MWKALSPVPPPHASSRCKPITSLQKGGHSEKGFLLLLLLCSHLITKMFLGKVEEGYLDLYSRGLKIICVDSQGFSFCWGLLSTHASRRCSPRSILPACNTICCCAIRAASTLTANSALDTSVNAVDNSWSQDSVAKKARHQYALAFPDFQQGTPSNEQVHHSFVNTQHTVTCLGSESDASRASSLCFSSCRKHLGSCLWHAEHLAVLGLLPANSGQHLDIDEKVRLRQAQKMFRAAFAPHWLLLCL